MTKYKVRSHRFQVSGIENRIRFEKVEKAIVRDRRFRYTMFSYAIVFLIFLNISIVHSPVIGIVASSVFFLIDAIFLGCAFFEKQDPFLRFVLGSLLLIVCLGLISWVVMMIYNLDAVRSTIVLCIVTTLSSFLSKMANARVHLAKVGQTLKHKIR